MMTRIKNTISYKAMMLTFIFGMLMFLGIGGGMTLYYGYIPHVKQLWIAIGIASPICFIFVNILWLYYRWGDNLADKD